MNKLPGLFSPKQESVYKNYLKDSCRIIILDGAKRAGKTQVNNFIFMNEILRVAEASKKQGIDNPLYLLGGFSVSSVEKNVLMELRNTFGIEIKLNKFNIFKLLGVNVVVFGHGTIRDASRIRGMTSFGAYINEGSLARNEAFKEVNSRCSVEGSRIIVDTNPDAPTHWLKVDYIDKADDVYISRYHFTLFDNTFLAKDYVDSIIATTPSGMFYKRDILGEWCIGEGVVYEDFDDDIHLVDTVPDKFDRFISGVDWGYEHYGTMVVLGAVGDTYYLIEEFAERKKGISYWVDVAQRMGRNYPNLTFSCDSARPEHINTFTRNGINAHSVKKGKGSVHKGIETVAKLIKEKKIFFKRSKFKHGHKEMYLYSWGNDGAPVKENDDLMDALRYAIMSDKLRYPDDIDKGGIYIGGF